MQQILVIKSHQLEARKLRNELEASLLTTLIGEAETIAKNSGKELISNEELAALIKKFVKGIDFVLSSTATETAKEKAKEEKKILEAYLPTQLSEENLRALIYRCVNYGNMSQGETMKYLKEGYSGCYDGKMASQIYKELQGEKSD